MTAEGGEGAAAKFMMLMPWGRVGSNLLFNNISQASRLKRRRFANENFNLLKDGERQLEWVSQFYGDDGGVDLIGSKQNMVSVRQPDGLARALAVLEVKLIRMRRRNIVKVAVSQLRAELYAERTRVQTGVAVWGVKADRTPLGPAELDPKKFLRVAGRALEADEKLVRFEPEVPTLNIEYEDIREDPGAVTARVCEWLGLDADQPIEPTYIKATPDDLALAVPNLSDLRAVLRASALFKLDSQFDE